MEVRGINAPKGLETKRKKSSLIVVVVVDWSTVRGLLY